MSRNNNLDYLNNIYSSKSNDIVIVYGSRYVGIRSVISDFMSGKETFYYKTRPCELRLQLSLIAKDIVAKTKISGTILGDFSAMIKYYSELGEGKKVIIFDDFTHLVKDNDTFLNFLISLIRDNCKEGSIMLILATEDISFIENDMVKTFGKSSYEIKGIVKVDALSPLEIMDKYKKISFNDLVSYYSVIGGNAKMWDAYEDGEDIKSFVCKKIITPGSIFNNYLERILPEDLREKSVYNTILYSLSQGHDKLNDLHDVTGYDRAKISVYIKNLSRRGLVEKASSVDIGSDNATKKGVYIIKDAFTRFYFRFIFGNLSMCLVDTPDKFYKKYIEPGLNAYKEYTYTYLCVDFLKNAYLKNDDYLEENIGLFYDKNEAIDFAGIDNSGKIFVGGSRCSQPHMAYNKLEEIISSCEKSKINFDYIFLLSAIDFDQKLHLYSSVHDNVRLIDFRD